LPADGVQRDAAVQCDLLHGGPSAEGPTPTACSAKVALQAGEPYLRPPEQQCDAVDSAEATDDGWQRVGSAWAEARLEGEVAAKHAKQALGDVADAQGILDDVEEEEEACEGLREAGLRLCAELHARKLPWACDAGGGQPGSKEETDDAVLEEFAEVARAEAAELAKLAGGVGADAGAVAPGAGAKGLHGIRIVDKGDVKSAAEVEAEAGAVDSGAHVKGLHGIEGDEAANEPAAATLEACPHPPLPETCDTVADVDDMELVCPAGHDLLRTKALGVLHCDRCGRRLKKGHTAFRCKVVNAGNLCFLSCTPCASAVLGASMDLIPRA